MHAMIRRLLALWLAVLAACSPQPPTPRIDAQAAVFADTPPAAPLAPDFVSLVKREGPTVVNISTTRTASLVRAGKD